ncbi:MAG: outer membrane protein assembly factor BamA [Xanthomonadales bacterium PRO7]|jgi:outer membrane protein insertion porin family|nr:outer membrane protein assembly factor BamA [Xanthomonadales bacterium PRO7]HMM57661.1 outer membrane protein assembly factor BamA [Rudaea sp.]
MKRIAALVLLACLAAKAHAFDPFVASDIRIDGLQRISAGTVFTYLPVEKGDQVTNERAAQAIRALYKTGFFSDVSVARQDNILVITVKERPAISKIQIKGNKDLKTEDLLKGLKDIGLSDGEPFDRLSLDRVTQELTRQYYNRGKYNVTIKPTVINLDRNRVELAINIAEGKVAKIKQINVVGNHAFTQAQIRDDFESDTSNWTSWYSKDDQYSREKLSGDLEKLNSFYLDRGYADFSIDSTQVSISPDKRAMYVTADITEGNVYKISDVKLSGDLVLAEADMRKLIVTHDGDVFSRQKLEKSAQQMTAVLANIGYAFAQVTPIPSIDREKRTVGINFFVNPGKRVYVRRIVFKGNLVTQDEVMRREMRQLEGAWYSQAAIDRSKVRLQRLGYFSKVDITTPKVPGTDDQVDVDIAVTETSSGAFTFGVGYSQVYGLVLSTSVSQNNFLGTGDRAALTVSKSDFVTKYALSYYQPYLTPSGIGLGYDLSYSKLNQQQANLANYLSNTGAFSTYVGLPISENDTVNLQLGVSKTKILTGYPVAETDANGNPIKDANGNIIYYTVNYSPQPIVDYIQRLNHQTFHNWSITASWAHDTRNKYFNPTHGSLQQLSAEVALPGSTVEYYKLIYRYAQYLPVTDGITFEGSTTIGYGNTWRAANGIDPATGAPLKVNGLPFFENFYAGGVSDVRSFRDNTLGPYALAPGCTDASNYYCRQPLGGNLKTVASFELIFPTPFVKDDSATRLSWYLDVGNVFNQNNPSLGNNLYSNNGISWSEMRASTGISLHWQAPVGPIVINLGRPIRSKPGDIGETLQFNFGTTF